MSWLLREVRPPLGTAPAPVVSVCVPVLDGGERLNELVDALLCQRADFPDGLEVLLADSGSQDGAFRLALERHPQVRGFAVAPRRFNHGLVRNEMGKLARGQLLAFLSQDAIPQPGCLTKLAQTLAEDPELAGVYARQVARPSADPLVQRRLEKWTPQGSEPVRQELSNQSWEQQSPREKMRVARFDNVCSMLRGDLLAESPFEEVDFGEDILWGAAMIRSGRAIAYVPGAIVEHSHKPEFRASFERNLAAHIQASRDFGLDAVPNLRDLPSALLSGVPADLEAGGPAWAMKGIPRRAAELAGQWLGGRRGRAQRKARK